MVLYYIAALLSSHRGHGERCVCDAPVAPSTLQMGTFSPRAQPSSPKSLPVATLAGCSIQSAAAWAPHTRCCARAWRQTPTGAGPPPLPGSCLVPGVTRSAVHKVGMRAACLFFGAGTRSGRVLPTQQQQQQQQREMRLEKIATNSNFVKSLCVRSMYAPCMRHAQACNRLVSVPPNTPKQWCLAGVVHPYCLFRWWLALCSPQHLPQQPCAQPLSGGRPHWCCCLYLCDWYT